MLIVLLLISFTFAECIFSQIQQKTESPLYHPKRKLASDDSEWVPLNVKFDTNALNYGSGYVSTPPVCFVVSGTCTQDNLLTQEKKAYIIRIIDEVQRLIKKYFRVHKGTLATLKSSIKDKDRCGEISSIKDNSIADDIGMVMYVTAHPIDSQTVLAYAASCGSATDASSTNPNNQKRNIFGYTNINPANLDVSEGKFRINVHTVLHETMHAMGFVSPTGMMSISKGRGTETVPVVTSEKVLKVAREHFGDNSISYVEFEDGGGSGTAGAHWEKRVLYNEIMTGTASSYSVISNFTLAYFEDLGTYSVNYSAAEPLTWGKGMKKDFFKCSNWPTQAPYYGETQARGCTPDRGAIGICDTSVRKDLPKIYQNYEDPTKGGMIELMDYCIHTTLVSGGQCYEKSVLSTENIASLSFLDRGSSYGKDSRCFSSSLMKYSIPISDFSCYRVKCVDRGYRVNVNGNWILCPSGESISVTGYGGVITCVNQSELCNGEVEEWPDIWRTDPVKGKAGSIVTLIGDYFSHMKKVYIGETEQTQFSIDNSNQVRVKIQFNDPFVNLIQLLSDGYVTVDIKIGDGNDINAVYQNFKLQVELVEVVQNVGQWLYKNLFFTVGIIIFLIFLVLLFGFIITKRIIYRRAKQVARNLV
ncbi:cell surface protease gp63, putative [Entamoeba nuttalli P19]|uniref:Cell surface protease gp63, putative n=1 Tax=Entamoeba nuttalli (strain P19) TaxID=1076696 RepID=K2H1S3_ENTNP|nr:cell surface protease gp63, putative [Entamoeba nuttalli P19]EKE40192.1 cell surface protease gp63, putative [Entamoeba nuttalli P19]|eukprot:XP_008857471.1 cell surface protease gp63, putative [Entamoeba nuttalli P19]